jgi:hypothetical protein
MPGVLLCRRAVELEARSREVRLQRALEEVERYKQLLQDAKTRVSRRSRQADRKAGGLRSRACQQHG